MHTQLLYIQHYIQQSIIYSKAIYSKALYTAKQYIQQSIIYSNYYNLTNALRLTQCLHTQLHCDSENQTRLHFQMTPTILLLGHRNEQDVYIHVHNYQQFIKAERF